MRSGTGSDVLLDRLLALHPKSIDLSLDRIERLLAALGNPERRLPPLVHVAGTNGKGSTIAMVRAGLEAAGAAVHVYTSPHLVRFHERIRIAGRLIAEDALAALLAEVEEANAGAPITFFEITTAAAFLAFSRTPAEWSLLEVGLGGRLDATNVIGAPRLSVITPVGLDHQQWLGVTLGEIAGEKAGILKPGVPAIVAPQEAEAEDCIMARAAALGVPVALGRQDWDVRAERGRLVFQDGRGLLDLDPPVLAGEHQVVNAGTAIAVLRALGAEEAACQAALSRAEWPARLQTLSEGPVAQMLPRGRIVVDGGHNADAGRAIGMWLERWTGGRRAARLVVGMLDTKAAGAFLTPLAPFARDARTVTIPNVEAAIPAESLAETARGVGIDARPAASVEAALAEIAAEDPTARVLICGSLYLAGAVLGADR